VLTPNERETLVLLGERGANISLDQALQFARSYSVSVHLRHLKLGSAEPGWLTASKARISQRPELRPWTAAAGDTFNGALVTALAEGKPLERAIDFATVPLHSRSMCWPRLIPVGGKSRKCLPLQGGPLGSVTAVEPLH
jgi:sugar/nucleoside kinase (ribokinase family)